MALSEDELGQKMIQLEKTVQTFRAEVNMKMSIMEQVLNNKNEQFQIQKDLLDREHSLYQTVLVHWKNIADMAANGLSLQFAQSADEDDVIIKPLYRMGKDTNSGSLGKRSSPSKARRERSKRLRAKRTRFEDEDDNSFEDPGDDSMNLDTSPGGSDKQLDIPGFDCDDDDYDSKGLEKKVYVNFYSTGTFKKGEKSNNLIWKYYLREENGLSAMCKLCEDEGIQHILKIRRGATWNLYRHLKRHIPNINFPQEDESHDDDDGTGEKGDSSTQLPKAVTTEESNVEEHDNLNPVVPSSDTSTNPKGTPRLSTKRNTRGDDGEEKLPGWMQCLEPFFDFVDFTGKKVTGTQEVVMRCKECAEKNPNNKGIRGRGSHNFARHLKIHPESNFKYISSLFEQKHNIKKEHQPLTDGSVLPFPM